MTDLVQKFSKNTLGRDLIVGDIHGHFSKLLIKLHSIGFDSSKDRLFSVGDLVDRGPESQMSFDWLHHPWFHAVCGNHEAMAIDYVEQPFYDTNMYHLNGGEWNIKNTKTDQRVYANIFSSMPVAIQLETSNGLIGIIHADCAYDSWDELLQILENPDTEHYALQDVIKECQWSRNRINNPSLSKPVTGLKALIVGHTPVVEMKVIDNVMHIDTAGWIEGHEFTIINADTLQKL